MNKYVRAPQYVAAVQWKGYNLKEVIELIGLHDSVKGWPWAKYEELVNREGLKVFQGSTQTFPNIGDYIARHPDGGINIFDQNTFRACYLPCEPFHDGGYRKDPAGNWRPRP